MPSGIYKRTKEMKERRSVAMKGEGNPRFGKKVSEETRKKMSVSRKGKPKSFEHCLKLSLSKIGEKNPSWRGGILSLDKAIRGLSKYNMWRKAVYSRDNYTCTECGNTKGGNLNADHIKSFCQILYEYNINTVREALFCNELWDIDNGRTLCVSCHKKTKTYGLNFKYVTIL